MIPQPFGDTVTLIRRTASGADADGQVVYAEAAEVIPGCVVYPTSSTEADERGTVLTDTLTAHLPPGTAVDGIAAAEVRGRRYEVEGVPFDWRSPFTGWNPGVELTLKAVS